MYQENANFIPGWKDMDKSMLCKKYLALKDANNPQADYYLAAIMCKYWPKVYRFYKDTPLVCTIEDCYDWLTESILEAFRRRPWDDPDNKLYTDPNAPDKVINCIMKCLRINFLVAVNRDKRKLNINILSKEEVDDSVGEDHTVQDEYLIADVSDWGEFEQKELISYLYNKQLYLLMFVCDAIMNLDCFKDRQLNQKKLLKEITSIDDTYINTLNEKYGIAIKDLKHAYFVSVKNKKKEALQANIIYALNNLKYLYHTEEI